ncbi:hypothetical protein V6N13_041459 [Hibiscus sabdariffa]|uniref:Uncharacterized protein n=1 Tax=Hibiscus sabdariffa TaxID=183260 RepID=A0ABR2RBD0_9ROSI
MGDCGQRPDSVAAAAKKEVAPKTPATASADDPCLVFTWLPRSWPCGSSCGQYWAPFGWQTDSALAGDKLGRPNGDLTIFMRPHKSLPNIALPFNIVFVYGSANYVGPSCF